MEIELTLNGERIVLEVPPEMPLLWVLRDRLRLTGTKFGCGIAQCGACTVHVDGNARRACVTPVASVAGAQVRTIEGLEGPSAEAVQSAWVALDVPQCGYCQSGQVMSAVALLESNPAPATRRSRRRWSAISVAAIAMCGSARPFGMPRT